MLRRTLSIVLVAGLIFVLAPSASAGGCHASSTATSARADSDATLAIAKCGFTPTILYVEPGSRVTWVNKDPMPHTVTGVGLSLGGVKNIQSGGRTEAFRFDGVGVYPYYCILHPGMAGAVVVGDVSSDKASADEVQSVPLAIPRSNDRPPAQPGGQGSSMLVPGIGAIVLVALTVGLVLGWRRRQWGSQPDGERERPSIATNG